MQIQFSKNILIISLCLISQSGLTDNLFLDSFESGDLSSSSASINTANFRWTDANRTSILTQTGTTAIREYPVQYFEEYTDGRNVTAKTGNRSLGIEYAAGSEMAEQRFALAPQNELWLKYWIRVPENYAHGVGGGNATNNKFLALWNDGYEGTGVGSTVWLGLDNSGQGNSNVGITWTTGGNTGSVSFEQYYDNFIIASRDRGRWMQMVVRVKSESSAGASDGVIQSWRRWEDESTFTQIHNRSGVPLRSEAGGFSAGYFLGWANGSYAEDTWWLIDDVTLSNSSLLDGPLIITPTVPTVPTDPTAPTGTLFSGSFESGDLTSASASTNTANFRWTDSNRSSILTQSGTTAIREYPVQYLEEYTDGRDVTAKTGNRSLGIEYAAGSEMAEQRFSLDPQNELWLRYWIRVPENYSHGVGGGNATNNKFLALWNDGYEGTGVGSTVWLGLDNSGQGNSNVGITWTTGGNTGSVSFEQYYDNFIIASRDRGRWMQMVVRVKSESSAGASDGVIQSWRRWEDESTFTQIHNRSGVPLRSEAGGFSAGYFLGWANGSYAEDTWWLIDDVTFSNSNLLDDSVTTTPVKANANPPRGLSGEVLIN